MTHKSSEFKLQLEIYQIRTHALCVNSVPLNVTYETISN